MNTVKKKTDKFGNWAILFSMNYDRYSIAANTKDEAEAENVRLQMEKKLKTEFPDIFDKKVSPMKTLDTIINKYKSKPAKVKVDPALTNKFRLKAVKLKYNISANELKDAIFIKNFLFNEFGIEAIEVDAANFWKNHCKQLDSKWENFAIYDKARIKTILNNFID